MERKGEKTLKIKTATLILLFSLGGCIRYLGPEDAVKAQEKIIQCQERNETLTKALQEAEKDIEEARRIIDGLENCP